MKGPWIVPDEACVEAAARPLPFAPARVSTALTAAESDLAWLAENGALDGVAEVIRERRRQIEQKGYTPERDRELHDTGDLMNHVSHKVAECRYGLAELSEGPEFSEEKMRQAGALAAAEIDRLTAEFSPRP